MNEKAFFNLDSSEPEADLEDRIRFLNKILNRHGVWFNLLHDKEGYRKLLVMVNPGTLKRHAGKRRQDIYLPDTSSRIGKRICTVDDVRKMESTGMTTSVITDLIRISRSTYFRRKKAAADKQGWEAF